MPENLRKEGATGGSDERTRATERRSVEDARVSRTALPASAHVSRSVWIVWDGRESVSAPQLDSVWASKEMAEAECAQRNEGYQRSAMGPPYYVTEHRVQGDGPVA